MAASVLKWFNKAEPPVEAKAISSASTPPAEVVAEPAGARARFLRPNMNDQAIQDLKSLLAISALAGDDAPAPLQEHAPLHEQVKPRTAPRAAAPVTADPAPEAQAAPIRQAARSAGSSPLSTPQALGLRIRTRRRELDLTQAQLAALAGVGKRFMVEVEQGKPTLELGKVMQVIAACGLALTVG